jgi:SAM-dependent methyltransferase
VREDFDRIADLSREEGWDHSAHYHAFLLRQLPPRLHEALEVGCGTGACARPLAGRSERVLAIDLSPRMIEIAKVRSTGHPNVEYAVADANSWGFPLERCDCVASITTLHHLPLAPTLAKIGDALRPGGTLLALDLYEASGVVPRSSMRQAFTKAHSAARGGVGLSVARANGERMERIEVVELIEDEASKLSPRGRAVGTARVFDRVHGPRGGDTDDNTTADYRGDRAHGRIAGVGAGRRRTADGTAGRPSLLRLRGESRAPRRADPQSGCDHRGPPQGSSRGATDRPRHDPGGSRSPAQSSRVAARLFIQRRGKVILRSSVFKHYVQAEGRRPGEHIGSMTKAGRWVIVLVEALVSAQ